MKKAARMVSPDARISGGTNIGVHAASAYPATAMASPASRVNASVAIAARGCTSPAGIGTPSSSGRKRRRRRALVCRVFVLAGALVLLSKAKAIEMSGPAGVIDGPLTFQPSVWKRYPPIIMAAPAASVRMTGGA
jgi:hypothetical protein